MSFFETETSSRNKNLLAIIVYLNAGVHSNIETLYSKTIYTIRRLLELLRLSEYRDSSYAKSVQFNAGVHSKKRPFSSQVYLNAGVHQNLETLLMSEEYT